MSVTTFKVAFMLLMTGNAVQLSAQALPNDFVFAKMEIGDWSLKAKTEIAWSNEPSKRLPSIESINCYGQSADADLHMNASGALDLFFLRFRGPSDEEGELGEITLTGDRLWLFVDNERWEYANIEQRSSEFLNVKYPVYIREDEIIIPVWRGFRAVRKSPKDPWTHMSMIYDRLLSAKKLSWGFKSRDWNIVNRELNELPKGWQNARFRIDNSNWRAAIDWCSRQVASDEARKMPENLLKLVEQ